MRFRTVSLAYMCSVGILALGCAGVLTLRNWERLREASEAQELIDVLKPTVRFVEALARERGAYNQALVAKAATPPAMARKIVADRRTATEQLFVETLAEAYLLPSKFQSQITQPIERARMIVNTARAGAEPFLDPGTEPSIKASDNFIALIAQAGLQIDAALASAEHDLSHLDPELGLLLEISRLSNDLREQAGLRSTYLVRYAATRQPFSVSDRVQTAEAAGAVKITWRRLRRLAEEAGGSRVIAAVATVKTRFFDEGEPIYTAMTDAARDGSKPPLEVMAFRDWTADTLGFSLAARDPPLEEAAAMVGRLREEARAALQLGLGAVGALFVLLFGVGLFIDLRVLGPIGRLTQALDAFSRSKGDQQQQRRQALRLSQRFGLRQDEIGSLSRALSRLGRYASELETLNTRFDAVLGNLPQGVCFYDSGDRLIVANRRYSELYGLDPAKSPVGRKLEEVVADRTRSFGCRIEGADEELRNRLQGRAEGEIARTVTDLPGGRVVALNGVRVPGGGWLATHLDITALRRTELQLAFLADHDPLTGLANRTLLARELEGALERVERGAKFAVMCLDLDRFKEVNDTLGHAQGDLVLKQVAQRLKDCVRACDSVARLGGDEFAIVLECAEIDLGALAQRLIEAVSQPYELEGCVAVVGTSIGIALAPQDGLMPLDLLKAADMALYRAKIDGRGGWRFFEPDMDAKMQARRLLELDLRGAIPNQEFELHYQPILDLKSREIVAFEALVRWNHPTRGRIPPMDFIPLAEDTGLIKEIGRWVLREACREAVRWPIAVRVAVNLSPRQFTGMSLLADVVSALSDAGFPASRLELEITEQVMLANNQQTLDLLQQIRALGVRIAMDDFGTGYSSLSYLRRFPFDKIKIDRTFVRDLASDPHSVSIVRAVAELGAGLSMSTTAEGVETEAQLQTLQAEGCTEAQGYLISPPVPAGEVAALLTARNGAQANAA